MARGREIFASEVLVASPPVPRRVYLPLTVLILWFIANAAFDATASQAPQDSPLVRAYLAVFGHRRWLFTWPLVAAVIWGVDTLVRKMLSRARGQQSVK
jgi:hypothetical protein